MAGEEGGSLSALLGILLGATVDEVDRGADKAQDWFPEDDWFRETPQKADPGHRKVPEDREAKHAVKTKED